MTQHPKPTGNPEFLTNGGLVVFLVAATLAVGIDWSLANFGSLSPPPLIERYMIPFSLPLTPFAMGLLMIGVTVALWSGGFLLPRWQVWIGASQATAALHSDWPLWRTAKLLVIAGAGVSIFPMLFFANLAAGLGGGGLDFEGMFLGLFIFPLYFAPAVIAFLAGLALADWLMFHHSNAGPSTHAAVRERGQLRATVLCAVYLFVVFDVALLLPRCIAVLLGPEQTVADAIVAGTGVVLIVWSAIAWVRARRVAR